MAIKTLKVVGDFETTTDLNDCRVWAACAVDIETLETVHLSNSIDLFFEWLQDKNTTCYFHNEKFDGEFIVSYLLTKGYKYSLSREPKTFSMLLSDTGQWYSVTVIFDKKNKKYKKATFYDSLKKLPFKVETIAKAFNLEDQKGEIDYKAYRPPGYVITKEEEDYIVKDCRIVAAALKTQFAKGLTKMTNASDALNGYKEIIDKKNFERWFPVLPVDLDADIRRAYKGGFVYLNPKYKNARGLQGITLDVNSLYPSVMYDCVLPFGYPMYFEGKPEIDDKYNLFIVRIECAFDLKPGHIPTLQLKNTRRFVETEYLTTSDGDIVEMTLTSVDLALLLDHYDVTALRYINGYKFKGVKGLFKDYIDYWMHIKETETGALRQLAKLMLNSLYGRFALNPNAVTKFPVLDENGIVHYYINNKENREKFGMNDLDDDELRDPVYTAMGAFITAYARNKTIRSAQAVYNRFIYADTDSLHLIGYETPGNIAVHNSKLGMWKNEGYFSDSKYIRAKTYMETIGTPIGATLQVFAKWTNKFNDMNLKTLTTKLTTYKRELNTKVTCAGMPDNVKAKVTYDNFHTGSTFDGKLMPRRCVGGVVLVDTTFTIK